MKETDSPGEGGGGGGVLLGILGVGVPHSS